MKDVDENQVTSRRDPYDIRVKDGHFEPGSGTAEAGAPKSSICSPAVRQYHSASCVHVVAAAASNSHHLHHNHHHHHRRNRVLLKVVSL